MTLIQVTAWDLWPLKFGNLSKVSGNTNLNEIFIELVWIYEIYFVSIEPELNMYRWQCFVMCDFLITKVSVLSHWSNFARYNHSFCNGL